ncbi:MAG: clostripain-related cysteine peptidase [Hyphomicrobiales bacterium]
MNKIKYIIFTIAIMLGNTALGQYCEAIATSPGTDYIELVSFEAIYNASGSDGYSDYTETHTANVYQGGAYQMLIVNASHHANNKMGVWIDWNADNDFSDDGEYVKVTYNERGVAKSGIANFNVPKDAQLGKTRMRVILTDEELTPCGSFYYGEVEDYTLVVGKSDVLPVVDFMVGNKRPYINSPVEFQDLSSALPTSFEWSFSPSTVTYLNGTNPNSADPVVEFDEGGLYTVTLKVKNSIGEAVGTKKDFIDVVRFNPPFNLKSSTEGDKVTLEWNAPIYESFEYCSDFALTQEPWTSYDGDSRPTIKFKALKFQNMGYTGSFIVFNPYKSVPAVSECLPVSGTRYVACFRNDGDFNNDWLISPKFKVENREKLSFFARTLSKVYSLDKFRVLVSETDTDIDSFEVISGNLDVTAPDQWKKYTYDLSKYQDKTIYVAIQCVSSYGLALCLDDISVIQGDGEVRWKEDFETRYLSGFNIYRDDEIIGQVNGAYKTKFVDTNVPDGKHVYSVAANYISPDCVSGESVKSEIHVDNSKPEIEVLLDNNSIELGERLQLTGFTEIGDSRDITFTIKNSGNKDDLTINNLLINGEEYEVTKQPETTVNAGEETTFTVKYSPKNQGGDILIVEFQTNDENEKSFNFEVKATTGAIWTWMIYLYEDGTGLNGLKDINELEVNGSVPDLVNYVVLYDADDDSRDGIYLVEKDKNGASIQLASHCIYRGFGMDFNMNSYETLERFIIWSEQHYPAKNYGLTVWDHGTGIFRGDNKPLNRGCVGDMKLWEMQKALNSFKEKAGKKLDVMAFDLCLMGQVETVYQLRDYADYVIASEKTEPEDGWEYDMAFKALNENVNITPEELSKNIVRAYNESYKNGLALQDNGGTTQSVTSVDKFNTLLIPAIDAFAEELIKSCADHIALIKSARSETYYSDGIVDHIDLGHFANKILDLDGLPRSLKDKAAEVVDAIDKSVLLHLYTKEFNKNTTGLKIWFPQFISQDKFTKYYEEDNVKYLSFGDTKWDEFLQVFEDPKAPSKPFIKLSVNDAEVRMLEETSVRDESICNPIASERTWSIEPKENVVFTNGTTVNSKAPTFYFTAPGEYDLSLTLKNDLGEQVLKQSKVFKVSIPNVPKPELEGSLDEKKSDVTLEWKASEELGKTFYEDAETSSTEKWIVKTSSVFEYNSAVVPPQGATTWQICTEETFQNKGNFIHSGKRAFGLGYDSKDFNWLVSPEITIGKDDDLGFWVWYQNAAATTDGQVYYTKFYVVILEGEKMTPVIQWNKQDSPSNRLDSQVVVDLEKFEGKTIRLAFVYEYSDGYQLTVDDVAVGKITNNRGVDTYRYATKGFNIYKNGKLLESLNDANVRTYTDESIGNGDHEYTVSELFSNPDFEGVSSNVYNVNLNGVEEIQEANIEVYPNPATDYVYIELPEVTDFTIELVNGFGATVQKFWKTNSNTTKVDLSAFAPGVYLIKINGDGLKCSKRLVID